MLIKNDHTADQLEFDLIKGLNQFKVLQSKLVL